MSSISDTTLPPFNVELEAMKLRVSECETRVASLMWVLGVIRRGVEWKEDSPILRLIDRTLDHEQTRESEAPLGSNVTRMTARR
ncbi:MAG: hypothetical protein JWN93_2878 [Hyphomicrobiales bacterium]|nr:hypothetical protein [Hyphomicrobiales bacterium]